MGRERERERERGGEEEERLTSIIKFFYSIEAYLVIVEEN